MPVFQQLNNYDRIIHQLIKPPIIINDLIDSSEEDRESIKQMIFTKYSTDMLSILPSCECGKTEGEYSLGTVCIHCGTVVKSKVEEVIEPLVWFRKPVGVNKLINPVIMTMLNTRFKKSGFEVIKWLCDTTYKSPVRQPKIINTIMDLGIQRGYNNFVDNFDAIMVKLFELRDFRLKRNTRDYLLELIQTNRQAIFSDYIPLPNKSLLIIEKTNVGIYIDTTIIGAIDAMGMITSIDSPLAEHSVRTKENRTIKAIIKLSEFYENFYKNNLAKKTGVFRRNVVGSRSHFSFRAVASSITGVHKYDELYAPWGVGITAFREHLVNKLFKRGWTYNKSIGFLYGHVEVYHPLIDEMLQELISESQDGKLMCILQRN